MGTEIVNIHRTEMLSEVEMSECNNIFIAKQEFLAELTSITFSYPFSILANSTENKVINITYQVMNNRS